MESLHEGEAAIVLLEMLVESNPSWYVRTDHRQMIECSVCFAKMHEGHAADCPVPDINEFYGHSRASDTGFTSLP